MSPFPSPEFLDTWLREAGYKDTQTETNICTYESMSAHVRWSIFEFCAMSVKYT